MSLAADRPQLPEMMIMMIMMMALIVHTESKISMMMIMLIMMMALIVNFCLAFGGRSLKMFLWIRLQPCLCSSLCQCTVSFMHCCLMLRWGCTGA